MGRKKAPPAGQPLLTAVRARTAEKKTTTAATAAEQVATTDQPLVVDVDEEAAEVAERKARPSLHIQAQHGPCKILTSVCAPEGTLHAGESRVLLKRAALSFNTDSNEDEEITEMWVSSSTRLGLAAAMALRMSSPVFILSTA